MKSPAVVALAALLLSVAAGGAFVAADPYFNSSEPSCDGSDPNVVWCDDFDTANGWLTSYCDAADPRNNGWNATPFAAECTNGCPCGTPLGARGGSVAPPATVAGAGVNGTNAATSGLRTGREFQAPVMADHNLGPNASSYDEIYFRFYVKVLRGYVFGAQKIITFNSTPAGSGGITIGGVGAPNRWGTFEAVPVYDGNILSRKNRCSSSSVGNLEQNRGRTLSVESKPGHWFYVEMHVKMNTPGVEDGVFELWMNDCGTTGLCTGSPTLRSSYTNATRGCGVAWQGPTSDGMPGPFPRRITSVWVENWANPPSRGTMYYDNIKVSRVGPIGFVRIGG